MNSFLLFFIVLISFTTLYTVNAAACNYDGIDFTKLPQRDLWGLDEHYTEIYYVRPCGTVQNLWCQLNANTADSMACQVNPGSTSVTYSLGQNTTDSMIWSGSKSSGTITYTQKNGDFCGPSNSDRVNVVNFVCGQEIQGQPDFVVTEGPQCTYNFNVQTPLMC